MINDNFHGFKSTFWWDYCHYEKELKFFVQKSVPKILHGVVNMLSLQKIVIILKIIMIIFLKNLIKIN